MTTNAVFWAVAGILLLIAEVVSGSFVLVFFALAAWIVLVAKLFGLQNTPIELIVFAAAGCGLLVFRKPLQARFLKRDAFRSDVSEHITLSTTVPANGSASVEYQGTLWTAVNDTASDMKSGERVKIVRIEGIRLYLEKP